MQHNPFGLDPSALDLLQEEWRKMPRAERPGVSLRKGRPKPGRGNTGGEQPHELSPIIAVLPGLIRLAEECTDRPVNRLRSTIKRMILEQLFMEVGGDAVVDPHHNLQVKQYVDLTVRVLARLRRHGVGRDEWSDMPVTPQMFG